MHARSLLVGLSRHSLCRLAVALAFRAQLVESVPTAPNDRGVDIVVTADREILCSMRARQRVGPGSS